MVDTGATIFSYVIEQFISAAFVVSKGRKKYSLQAFSFF
jgi:hypothetical protein